MKPELHLGSTRARKARISVALDSTSLRMLLKIVALLSLVGWAGIVFGAHILIGHVLLITAAAALMPLFWFKGELENLLPISEVTSDVSIDSVLDRRILGRLRANSTPADLVPIVMQQPGGIFYANRYAISSEILRSFLANDTDLFGIWQKSIELAV